MCIAISTGVDEIEAIVAGQVTDLVNILCVETGFGGQAFQVGPPAQPKINLHAKHIRVTRERRLIETAQERDS